MGLALEPDAIDMTEVDNKKTDGFAKTVYHDKIKHLRGTAEWSMIIT